MDSIPLLEPHAISRVASTQHLGNNILPSTCNADKTANDVSFFLVPCERRAVDSQDEKNTIEVPLTHTICTDILLLHPFRLS